MEFGLSICHNLSLIILKSHDRGWQFWKFFGFTWFRIKFQEKSPNVKELAQKLQELWTKTFGGHPSLNSVNYSNEKFPYPGESCIVNSLPLGQSKVVNLPPYPRRWEGDPRGLTW